MSFFPFQIYRFNLSLCLADNHVNVKIISFRSTDCNPQFLIIIKNKHYILYSY
jgi:hypothetical protein